MGLKSNKLERIQPQFAHFRRPRNQTVYVCVCVENRSMCFLSKYGILALSFSFLYGNESDFIVLLCVCVCVFGNLKPQSIHIHTQIRKWVKERRI